MIKIAHRGYSHDKKDNSIMAFKSAIEFNFDILSLKVLREEREGETGKRAIC